MKTLKLAAYALLLVLLVVFFQKFRREYQQASDAAASAADRKSRAGETTETNRVQAPEPEQVADTAAETNPAAAGFTGVVPVPEVSTNEVSTNELATNVVADISTNPPTAGPVTPRAQQPGGSGWPLSLGVFVACLMGVGGMAAWDFSRWIASRSHAAMFLEDEGVEEDPDYEVAEEAWKRGEYLEAVNLMREYLKRNPSEVHVSIRIAEIYEKDLNNPLVASMELEEVLGKKLPSERWGWTAIHLANLYSGRLAQPEKALAILHRVINEHPNTGAARKARSRLGIPEGEDSTETAETPEPRLANSPSPEPEPEIDSNLPRGFKPKK